MTNTAKLPALVLNTLLVALYLAFGVYVLVASLAPAPAEAHAVCTTDLDCAAYELQTALYTGATVHEDLSFTPGAAVYEDGSTRSGEVMSELYSAKNDLLADAFWAAHAGEDWDSAKRHLAAWLDAYRAG